jgi:hypothetical protein
MNAVRNNQKVIIANTDTCCKLCCNRTSPTATQRSLDARILLGRLSSVDLLSVDVTLDAPY